MLNAGSDICRGWVDPLSQNKLLVTVLLLVSTLVAPISAQEQSIPPGGQELIRKEALRNVTFSKADFGSLVYLKEGDLAGAFRITVDQQPKHIYNLSKRLPLKEKSLSSGQVLLLSFRAKTESASLETGEAKLMWRLTQSDNHKDKIARTSSIGAEWRTFYIPFELTQNVSAEDFSLSIQFGYPPQQLLISDVSLLSYGPEQKLESLPRTRIEYTGRDPNAEWRRAALTGIERERKGAFSLRLVDEHGESLKGINVEIKQVKHHFDWGAAVNARQIVNDPTYFRAVANTFNTIVFENDLKIKRWQSPESRTVTLAAIDRLNEAGIKVKGHVLIWPGFRYLIPAVRDAANDPVKVNRLMREHVASVIEATKGKIAVWDVVNEAYSNRDLQRITGSEEILQMGFTALKDQDPGAKRYTNEFGIISRGGHDLRKQKWYYDYVARMDSATGGLVDGIGIQCHMGSDLTPPEQVMELLDYYGELGKEISISEFTIDLDDPETRFDYTRDFMIAAFSRPAVKSFLFWGFHSPTHPKSAILDENYRPADMGSAYFALVKDLWTSKLNAATDAGGRVQGKVFYGDYEYEYRYEGEVRKGEFSVLPDSPVMLEEMVR